MSELIPCKDCIAFNICEDGLPECRDDYVCKKFHGKLGNLLSTRQEPKPDILEALNSMNIQEESQVHNILDCLPNSLIATYFEKYGLTKQDKSCDEKPQCMVCERKARCPIVGRVQCTYFKPTNK